MKKSAKSGSTLPPPGGLVASRLSVGPHELVVFEWPLRSVTMPPHLSFAEVEVARLACDGLSNLEIARRRGTSVRTVANQMASVFRKLGVGSRHEIVAMFAGRGGGERAR